VLNEDVDCLTGQLRETREGHLRFSYVTALDQIEEALNRMEKIM
jgi:aspartate/methionine/tyrosine aminotransferase